MNNKNPWRPLISYNETDKDSFYGRDIEISEFYNIVDNELISTLYGKSGVGKSSFLKAGIFPKLRPNSYFPIYIRLNDYILIEKSYTACIIDIIENIDKLEIIEDIEDKNNKNSLWHFFHSRTFKNGQNEEVYPVIVLDQFEEILLRNENKAKELIKDLYSLISNNQRIDKNYKIDTNYRFIISLREDYLYLLEDIIENNNTYILKDNRYRLRAFKKETAEEIIKSIGKNHIEDDVNKVVSSLVNYIISYNHNYTQHVEPIILSLVCYMVFEKTSKIKEIDISNLKEANPLIDYYNKATQNFSSKEKRFIEDQMIAEDGRRISIPEDLFNKNIKTKTDNYPIFIKNANNYEIAHDLMAKDIFRVKNENKIKNTIKKTLIFIAILSIFIFIHKTIDSIYYYDNEYITNNIDDISTKDARKEIYSTTKELHLSKNRYNRLNTFFPNLRTIHFGDSAILYADIEPHFAPKLEKVVISGDYCSFLNRREWYKNISEITINNNVKKIDGDFHIKKDDVYFNILNNKNFISLYTDIILQKRGSGYSILFAGNVQAEGIIIPNFIKLNFRSNLLKIAKIIELENLDSIKNNADYYYVVNNNKDIKVIYNTSFNTENLTYIHLANIEDVIKLKNKKTKELILPNAKYIHKIEMPSLRKLNIPIITEIKKDALHLENIKEIILPSHLCKNIDTLQNKCIYWGIKKFIKKVVPLNNSTSSVIFNKKDYLLYTDIPEIVNDTIYNYCSYNKNKVTITENIKEIYQHAFNAAINIEELSVSTKNDKYISINNTIRKRNKVHDILHYAQNAKEIILSGNYQGELNIGNDVKEITLLCPEVITSYNGENLNEIVLKIPKYKNHYITTEIKNKFKKIEFISGYKLIYHNLAIIVKKYITTKNNLIGIIIILSSLLLSCIINRTRYNRISIILCIVLYPIIWSIFSIVIMANNIKYIYFIFEATPVIITVVISSILSNLICNKNKRLW